MKKYCRMHRYIFARRLVSDRPGTRVGRYRRGLLSTRMEEDWVIFF